eukprot:TRINITY_DN35852_c0_g1_i1.p1 TRINITY_DN35852_c0_g1~~TRINITY_DN35852_c0_g1_i1.p1  ORF type:complete len:127 (+),score=31.40 TRINITY_DN35852_c0_g1_i1:2-382(+)
MRVIPVIRLSGEQLDDAIAAYNASKQDMDLATLNKASIIGATTSGMARMMNMMSRIPFETVIMEEAAEISEVHAIAAIPPTAKHIIQIGDHQHCLLYTSDAADEEDSVDLCGRRIIKKKKKKTHII